jgi:hypothetical protein
VEADAVAGEAKAEEGSSIEWQGLRRRKAIVSTLTSAGCASQGVSRNDEERSSASILRSFGEQVSGGTVCWGLNEQNNQQDAQKHCASSSRYTEFSD